MLLCDPAIARADRKSFANTYEYATLPEGQTEVELWHTQMRDTWDAGTPQRFEEKLEIEHGITDHWDMAMYTVFQEVSASDPLMASPLGLDSVHLETRYRIADRGELPVDTVLYLELSKDFGQSIYEIESKVIVARDFDRVTAALNLIDELYVGNDVAGGSDNLIGFAFGVTYEVTPKVRIGAETWGNHGDGVTRISAGPALALAPTSKFWLVGTAGFGLDIAPNNPDVDQNLAAFSGRIVMGFSL